MKIGTDQIDRFFTLFLTTTTALPEVFDLPTNLAMWSFLVSHRRKQRPPDKKKRMSAGLWTFVFFHESRGSNWI